MIPVRPSGLPPATPTKEQRRRDIRNYGLSLLACCAGFGVGFLIRRSGWGGDFGTLFAFLSGVLALVCGVGLTLAWKR